MEPLGTLDWTQKAIKQTYCRKLITDNILVKDCHIVRYEAVLHIAMILLMLYQPALL